MKGQTTIHFWRNKMEIYKIKNLDCSVKKNRIKLMKLFMKEFKIDKIPGKEKVGRFSKKLEKKFNMPLVIAKAKDCLVISIRTDVHSYSCMECHSVLEAYLKHCLFIKYMVEYQKRCDRFVN